MFNEWLPLTFFSAAWLYGSVGHGGASGYLAVMALAGFLPAHLRPIALFMNVAVASVAWLNFTRAGYFKPRQFWPLVVLSVPCAYLGGSYKLPEASYSALLGSMLLLSALWLLFQRPAAQITDAEPAPRALPAAASLGAGAGIGALAGLTGIGGGVLLSPLLILGRFARTKEAGALAAGMIVLNSLAGLIAQRHALHDLPVQTGVWVLSAFAGGAAGSALGAYYFSPAWLRRVLALLLLVAAGKLLMS